MSMPSLYLIINRTMASIDTNTGRQYSLTRFPAASLRELLVLSSPIILLLVCTNLASFCDRFFLSRYSFEAFRGCVSASFLCILFQIPCIRLTAITQVFVGYQNGR